MASSSFRRQQPVASTTALGVLIAWLIACVHVHAEDLSQQLYRAALRSDDLTELIPEGIDEFIGVDRPAAVVAIMFHESSCGICHGALPEVDSIAKTMKAKGVDISFGHLEASSQKDSIKRRFSLRGFPSLVVFRQRSQVISDRDRPEALIGKRLKVTEDTAFLLSASQNAKMGQDRNPHRLKSAGQDGEVLSIDLVDSSAQLQVSGVGKVWFPLEALQHLDGTKLPYQRSEAAFMYLGAWRQAEMQQFVERMLAPLVETVRDTTRDAVRKSVEKELWPALFFCGGEKASAGFWQSAATVQGKMRAFHVPDLEACPAPASTDRFGKEFVVIYSPPGQQWAASTRSLKAGVSIAGSDVVNDDRALVKWMEINAWPGILELQFHSFPDFVNAARHGLIIAVRGPRGAGGEVTKMVERKLQEVGKPEPLDSRTDLYSYSSTNSSYFLAVIDGTLDGLTNFGVYPQKLPRVLIFEGGSSWVEDETQLRVEHLHTDLRNLPQLWRSSNSPFGYVTWALRQTLLSFQYYHETCIQLFGNEVGRFVMPIAGGGFGLFYAWQLMSLLATLARSLLQSDVPAVDKVDEKDTTSKKSD